MGTFIAYSSYEIKLFSFVVHMRMNLAQVKNTVIGYDNSFIIIKLCVFFYQIDTANFQNIILYPYILFINILTFCLYKYFILFYKFVFTIFLIFVFQARVDS